MPRNPLTLTRQTLYDLIWSKPMSTLAKGFGISDLALSRWQNAAVLGERPLDRIILLASRHRGGVVQQNLNGPTANSAPNFRFESSNAEVSPSSV
jgi:hypothetical protein